MTWITAQAPGGVPDTGQLLNAHLSIIDAFPNWQVFLKKGFQEQIKGLAFRKSRQCGLSLALSFSLKNTLRKIGFHLLFSRGRMCYFGPPLNTGDSW